MTLSAVTRCLGQYKAAWGWALTQVSTITMSVAGLESRASPCTVTLKDLTLPPTLVSPRSCANQRVPQASTWVEVFDPRWEVVHSWGGCPTWQLSRVGPRAGLVATKICWHWGPTDLRSCR